MRHDEDNLIYAAAGPAAAVVLSLALIPFRDFTTASNFTFVFMALTIVVSEFGGRRAALATAVTSVLSLDFFLTRPYLTLRIADKHDIIAFVGLAVCGVIAAALGSQRGERAKALLEARMHLDLLHTAVRQVDAPERVETTLARVLNDSLDALPLAAAVVRDPRGQVVAASERAQPRPVPTQVLNPETLLPLEIASREFPRSGLPLPAEGGRIALVGAGGQVGWLDVWGNGVVASMESRRVLSDVGALAALTLARRTA